MIIEDLSYSNLVKIIQGEEIIAGDILHSLAIELEDVRNQIIETESKIKKLKNHENSLIQASQRILKHIDKAQPLIVQRNGYIITVTENNLLIERNVI